MSRFSHLTDKEYRACQCQVLAAMYAERARKLRDTRWPLDAVAAQEWAAHYAASARNLINATEVR